MVDEIPLMLPRHATSPRRVARPAAIWRLLQDAAVQASAHHGWPPQRYHEHGVALILARMTVVHHGELSHGLRPFARTWVQAFHRRTLTDRELRLRCDRGIIAHAHQRWAHVSVGDQMALCPASDALINDFQVHPTDEPATALPRLPKAAGPVHAFAFRCWFTWLDPLAHVNHPNYLEWCDEALMQFLHAAGVPPWDLQPIAETVTYRNAVEGDDPVEVRFQLVGADDDGAAQIRCSILNPNDEQLYARAVLLRRLVGGRSLAALLT